MTLNIHRVLLTIFFENKDIKVLEWPSQSIDMNSIEHIWTILKKNVHLRKPKNIKELEKYVVEEWYKTPKCICEKLVFQ
ncbi:hypothetical protein A0H76_2395 [Hepatospora eriocheir]|uniref:Tc1-like transposase DDE domain-containing protein n=1 Tax=Hepatospora eriocheir TaxID=1081669 RepID=A0A1X0QFG0_9MICR|nr:hypothetical protein A0H76_2395 [Hepatospora eriocheir]